MRTKQNGSEMKLQTKALRYPHASLELQLGARTYINAWGMRACRGL